MIASPSDVQKERDVIREVIHEWNVVHSSKNNIVLLPVGWETHTTPEMGEHPQDIINKQILHGSDMLIGVFWTRLGTPTGKATSGTVEEINEFIKLSKPVMLYFSNQPVAPASVDNDQLNAVKSFKEEIKNKGLFSEYGSHEEFRTKFSRQLAQTVERKLLPLCSKQETLETQFSASTTLSEEAKNILLVASDGDGHNVIRTQTRGGLTVQSNSHNFCENATGREAAKWKSALEILVESSCLKELGNKGEILEVTQQGYKTAATLRP